MNRFIIRENIRRFERLLSAVSGDDRRRAIETLLDNERMRLSTLDGIPVAPAQGTAPKARGRSPQAGARSAPTDDV